MTETEGNCVQRALVDRYVLRELAEADAAQFEQHYFDCAICAEEIRLSSAVVDGAHAALGPRAPTIELVPAGSTTVGAPTPVRVSWRRRLGEGLGLWPWGGRTVTVGVLGALVALQGLVIVPGLRREIAERDQPAALTPITLRPLTRGRPPRLAIAPGTRSLAVQLDVPATNAAAYRARLLGPDGAAVSRFGTLDVPRPASGDPIQVLIPIATLPSGLVTLELSSLEGGRVQIVDRYQFVFDGAGRAP